MTCNYIIHFGNVGMEGVSALGGSSVQEVSRIVFDSWTIVTLHYRSTHTETEPIAYIPIPFVWSW